MIFVKAIRWGKSRVKNSTVENVCMENGSAKACLILILIVGFVYKIICFRLVTI